PRIVHHNIGVITIQDLFPCSVVFIAPKYDTSNGTVGFVFWGVLAPRHVKFMASFFLISKSKTGMVVARHETSQCLPKLSFRSERFYPRRVSRGSSFFFAAGMQTRYNCQ